MKRQLPNQKKCSQAASILKALAHRQRLFILCSLYQKESTVSDLEKLCKASQPVISQHLTRMRLEGIVDSRREGNFVYYRIADPRVATVIETLENIFNL